MLKLPDTPSNRSLKKEMGGECKVNLKTATDHYAESIQFTKAAAILAVPANPDLVAAWQYWKNSDLATSFLVPDQGTGIFRKEFQIRRDVHVTVQGSVPVRPARAERWHRGAQ